MSNIVQAYISYDEEKNCCCLSIDENDYMDWIRISPYDLDSGDLEKLKEKDGQYITLHIDFN